MSLCKPDAMLLEVKAKWYWPSSSSRGLGDQQIPTRPEAAGKPYGNTIFGNSASKAVFSNDGCVMVWDLYRQV